ncbi:exopolysaccharide biosynthesis protein [Roseibium sp. M-1]
MDNVNDKSLSPISILFPENGRRLSRILADLLEDGSRERVSVGDILAGCGQRAFGAMIFLFAVPNLLPVTIPGVSALFGAPLLFITWQLAYGRGTVWLPAFISKRSFARKDFEKIVNATLPFLKRIEKVARPRLALLTTPTCERFIGLVGLLLAMIIFLPIPFGNMLPGLALALLALGILERDGLAVLAGLVAALAGFVLVSGVVYGLVWAAFYLLQDILLKFA